MSDSWRRTVELAGRLVPTEEYTEDLAQSLREAAGVEVAGIGLCPLGDWKRLRFTARPVDFESMLALGVEQFPARADESGDDWRANIQAHGLAHSPRLTLRCPRLVGALGQELLEPHGLSSLVVGYLLGPGRSLVGMIVLAGTSSERELSDRTVAPLARVCEGTGAALTNAIQLAEHCGFKRRSLRPPARSTELSPREREVAALAAEGYSNLNIAARLGIAPATVSVHLQRVYRKLDIHSRVDLARLYRQKTIPPPRLPEAPES